MAEGRIGVLGGTFDPVHVGHLALAEAARKQLGLQRVLFVPAGQPWRKSDRAVTPVEHRVAMVRIAIGDEPAFQVCTIEVERAGASYTAETLERLVERFPGRELVLIVGEDALEDMPNWREPERILDLALLAIAPRVGRGPKDESWRALPGIGERTVWLEMPPVDVSSSSIRSRMRRGAPVGGMVPPAVEAYFREHRLYARKRIRSD